jgi:hypothetical protein
MGLTSIGGRLVNLLTQGGLTISANSLYVNGFGTPVPVSPGQSGFNTTAGQNQAVLGGAGGAATATYNTTLFCSTAASSAVSNTTSATTMSTTATVFSGFFTAGHGLRIRGIVVFSSTLSTTLTLALQMAGSNLGSITITTAAAASSARCNMDLEIVCYATGAVGTASFVRGGLFVAEATTGQIIQNQGSAATSTWATNASNLISVLCTWGAASVSNTAVLEYLKVEAF